MSCKYINIIYLNNNGKCSVFQLYRRTVNAAPTDRQPSGPRGQTAVLLRSLTEDTDRQAEREGEREKTEKTDRERERDGRGRQAVGSTSEFHCQQFQTGPCKMAGPGVRGGESGDVEQFLQHSGLLDPVHMSAPGVWTLLQPPFSNKCPN